MNQAKVDALHEKYERMYAEAKTLQYRSDQDAAINAIIKNGLRENRPDLVIAYVDGLQYESDRDAILMELIELFLASGNLDNASELLPQLRYGSDRDRYTKLILAFRSRSSQ